MCCCCLVAKSCPALLATHQAPLCMGFPRQEYWSGLPFPSPGDQTHTSFTGKLIPYHWTTRETFIKNYRNKILSALLIHTDKIEDPPCLFCDSYTSEGFEVYVWSCHFPPYFWQLFGGCSALQRLGLSGPVSPPPGPLCSAFPLHAGGLTALFSEGIVRWDIFAKAEQLRPQLVREILTILRFPEFRGAAQGAYINLFWDKKLCFPVNSKV